MFWGCNRDFSCIYTHTSAVSRGREPLNPSFWTVTIGLGGYRAGRSTLGCLRREVAVIVRTTRKLRIDQQADSLTASRRSCCIAG
jgi:hypothetical protein